MAECYLTNQCQSLLQDTGSTDVSLNNVMYRQTVASGTIKNASLDYYSRIAFMDLCEGTRNAYLTLSGDVESEYELEPGGFYDGIYSLNYNGTIALSYSI